MPSQRLVIHLPASRLLIALVVLIVPICIAGLVSVAHADRAIERTVGAHFKTIAEISGSEVSRFIHGRVIDVGSLAMEPEIVEAAKASNAAYTGKTETAIAENIQQAEKIWNTQAAEPMVNKMLSSRGSQLLRKHREFDRRFLRITVTDGRGGTIAATHKTLDYYQADEDFWQAVYAKGRGAVSITDMLYDDVTKAYYIGIGVPIMDDSNTFLGVVDALVDVSTIFPIVNRMQFGTSSRLMLVKDDGTVIAAPGVDLAMKATSDEFAAVKESVKSIAGRQTGYVVAGLKSGSAVIGFADTGLKQDYGNLGWVVLAVQDTAEAFAPIRMVDRVVAFVSIIGLLALTLMSMYIYIHRGEYYEHFAAPAEPGSEKAKASQA